MLTASTTAPTYVWLLRLEYAKADDTYPIIRGIFSDPARALDALLAEDAMDGDETAWQHLGNDLYVLSSGWDRLYVLERFTLNGDWGGKQ